MLPRLVVAAQLLATGCWISPASDGGAGVPVAETNRPPEIEVAAPEGYVGYGAPVRIRATIVDHDGDPVAVAWEQVEGEPVELGGADSTTLAFTTHRLEDLAPPEEGELRVLSLTKRRAGHYRFRVTARDAQGGSSASEVDVLSGATNPGWPRLEQNVDTMLDLGLDQASYSWELAFSPPRAKVVIGDGAGRRTTVRVDSPGRYLIKERVSGRELALHAGPWMGTRQCARVECHPIETRGWALTKMATVLERGLDGRLRHDYGPECLRCHTVGWNEAAANDGFDDVARDEGWSFPRRLRRGNYSALPEKLYDRAGVGCEACHGPGRFYTSYSAEICAGCHDSPPDYVNPSEWRLAAMSTLREGIAGRPECERCHTAQGFIDEQLGHDPAEETAREDDVQLALEPITCGVCHDTHAGEAERLIRFGGPLYGQQPDDVEWGTGMICVACHHGGTAWSLPSGVLMRPFVPRERGAPAPEPSLWLRRRAPHAPQGEMVRGRAGHALPGPGPVDMTPPHLTVPGGCVGCHVRIRPAEGSAGRGRVGGHTFAMFHGEGDARVENTDACRPCHGELASLSRPARHDYDGDGRTEGIYEEVDGLLTLAKRALDETIRRADISDGSRRAASFGELDGYVVLVDDAGEPLGREGARVTLPLEEERLYRGIFNYLTIVKDRSRGVHNPVLTVRLLQRTILRLSPHSVRRWYWR